MSDFLKNPVRGQTRLLLKKEGRDKCLALYEEWVRDKIDKEGVEELMKIKDKILEIIEKFTINGFDIKYEQVHKNTNLALEIFL